MQDELHVRENIPLAPLTTLEIGGAARYFAEVQTENQLRSAVEFAADRDLQTFILGGGSNVLISDRGFDGLVIRPAMSGVRFEEGFIDENDRTIVRCEAGAGEIWDNFVQQCLERDLAGVECLSGIPGSVGGTPVQNVGAYGQEVSESISSVRCFDRHKNEFLELAASQCGFAYRTSIFNTELRDRYVVTRVTFNLVENGPPKISYKDLIERFNGRSASLSEVRDAVISIRSEKSMVIDAADPNRRSAGSFFKNPIVDRETLAKLEAKFGKVPFFEYGSRVKVPAAWLIDQAGFAKGTAFGNAGISSKHNLALINRGEATAAELLELKERISLAVREKFDIGLTPEPIFVGF